MGSLEEDSEYITIRNMQKDCPAGKAFNIDKHILGYVSSVLF